MCTPLLSWGIKPCATARTWAPLVAECALASALLRGTSETVQRNWKERGYMKSNSQRLSALKLGGLVVSTLCACGPGSSQPGAVNRVQQAWFEDNGPGLDGIRKEWKVAGFDAKLLGLLSLPLTILEPFLPGTRLRALTSGGVALPAQVVSSSLLLGAPDLLGYRININVAGVWSPLCGTDARGVPILAVKLPGTWDQRSGVPGGGDHIPNPQAFTLACEGSTLEKCAELYNPVLSLSVGAAHQACTRMLRADYCGDGTPHTNSGVVVDIHDRLGKQFSSASATWNNEAMWGEQGAGCIANLRVAALVPACLSSLLDPSCMDPTVFTDPKMLMMTKVVPN
jgi:hypothetical protein